MLQRQRSAIGARALVASIVACAFFAGGCSNYYKVTDPQSGRVYYSKSVEENSGGAVTLKDAGRGNTVTIQNSEVQKINKEEFESEKMNSGQVAGAKAAQQEAEARAAQEKAAQEQAAQAAPPAGEAAPAGAVVAGGAAGAVAAKAATPQQLRDDLAASKIQIERTLASLSQLTDPNQADLRAAYANYTTELDRLEVQGQQIRAEADAMHAAHDAYFAKWDARIAETANPTIRAEAEARRARLRDARQKITADAQTARDAYQPFMADLRDVRKFLATDVSKDTIAVLGPSTKKAQADGQALKQKLDAVIADLDMVQGGGAAAPGTPAAPGAAPAGGAAVPPPATPAPQ